MDIKVMRSFLAVVREGSVNAAAAKLFITQPALSKQLKDLEEELGQPLFTRGYKGITLTAAGSYFRQQAEEIIRMAETTRLNLQNSLTDIAGAVMVEATECHCCRYLSKAMKAVRQQFPNITFNTKTCESSDILEHIEQGRCDVGLVLGSIDFSSMEFIKLEARYHLGLVCHRDSDLAAKKVIHPADLLTAPLILLHDAYERYDLGNFVGVPKEQLNVVGTGNLVFNSAMMVMDRVGFAMSLEGLVPKSCVRDLVFVPFEPELCPNHYIVWKKGRILSRAAGKFLENVQLVVAGD